MEIIAEYCFHAGLSRLVVLQDTKEVDRRMCSMSVICFCCLFL